MQLEVVKRTDTSQYPQAKKGKIKDFCLKIYDELLTSGYSLLLEDIENIALEDIRFLASWTRLDCQYVDDERLLPKPNFIELTLDTPLLADEWAIVLPVIRSHCDLLQARRMEGSQALGIMPFSLASAEALNHYKEAKELMKKEAFCHTPFSIDWGL